MKDQPLPQRNILKGHSEESIVQWALDIQHGLEMEEDQGFVQQVVLDRGFLLGRVKLIAEALESREHSSNEIARWAREAFDMVKTWE